MLLLQPSYTFNLVLPLSANANKRQINDKSHSPNHLKKRSFKMMIYASTLSTVVNEFRQSIAVSNKQKHNWKQITFEINKFANSFSYIRRSLVNLPMKWLILKKPYCPCCLWEKNPLT